MNTVLPFCQSHQNDAHLFLRSKASLHHVCRAYAWKVINAAWSSNLHTDNNCQVSCSLIARLWGCGRLHCYKTSQDKCSGKSHVVWCGGCCVDDWSFHYGLHGNLALVKKYPPPHTHTVCLFHLYQAEMYVVAEKKKEFHIQRRKKIGRPCLLDHIQCFFFFWGEILYCGNKNKNPVRSVQRVFVGKNTKNLPYLWGEKKVRSIFREWVPVGRQNKAGF